MIITITTATINEFDNLFVYLGHALVYKMSVTLKYFIKRVE